jgi:hypothetical protein
MSEVKVYENQPKCLNGDCVPFDYCEEKISMSSGKPYRKCHKCNNLVFPPKKEQCPNKTCTAWDDAASTSRIDKSGIERRNCLVCLNLVFDPTTKKPGPAAGVYKRGASEVITTSGPDAETIKTLVIQVGNLNARLGVVEAKLAGTN